MNTSAITLRGLRLRGADDHALAASAAAGNSAAFAEIYRRYHTRVYAVCLSRLMDASAADDATQEVFIRLLAASPGSIGSLLPWLFGVARNVCMDMHRTAGRVSDAPLEDAAGTDTAECGAAQAEELERVALSLRRMSPRYRDAFLQSEIHERPPTEIAATLRIRVGAAYTLLSRARDAFAVSYQRVEQLPESCRIAARVMHQNATGSADAASLARLEMHLAACPECAKARRAADRTKRIGQIKNLIGLPFFARLLGSDSPWATSRLAPPEAALAVMNGAAALLVATTLTTGGAAASSEVRPHLHTHRALLTARHAPDSSVRDTSPQTPARSEALVRRVQTQVRLTVAKRTGAKDRSRAGSGPASAGSQVASGEGQGSGALTTARLKRAASDSQRGTPRAPGPRAASADGASH